MPRLLTRRKQAWVSNFKPDILRGDALAPNAAVAVRYRKRLDALIEEMTSEVERELKALFKDDAAQEFFATDASVTSQARIITNMLKQKFTRLFAQKSKTLAESLAGESDAASSKSVHLSVKKLSGGLSLPTAAMTPDLTEIFKATVHENVSLIKSISQKYLTEVEQAVMRSITNGEGLKTLVPFLQKHRGITYARAKVISLDQTRKAFQNMAAERMRKLGIQKAEWIHVPSNHPRKTHQEMAGKIYNIDKGLYDSHEKRFVIPGELVNCRCMARPIVEFSKD